MDKIKLWDGNIPGNSQERKDSVMEIGKKQSQTWLTIKFMLALRKKQFKERKKVIDTYTKYCVGETDKDYQQTFADVPYLIPYIAPGSQKAVIVVPGGGYTFKSMESEGTQIGEYLQSQGITAFVLWYRTNPYYQPIPLLDMQRAVRMVRYLAKEYGYDKNQISAIGFSAGGAQVALFMNLYRRKNLYAQDYVSDIIDETDDSLNYAALIYPALCYENNVPMLFASFPAEDVRNKKKREQLLWEYNAVRHMNCAGIPHYIGYGTKDDMISQKFVEEYVAKLNAINTPCHKFLVEGAGHGYGAAVEKYRYWMDDYVKWLKNI